MSVYLENEAIDKKMHNHIRFKNGHNHETYLKKQDKFHAYSKRRQREMAMAFLFGGIQCFHEVLG